MSIPEIVVMSAAGGVLIIPWIIQLIAVLGLRHQERATEPFLCKALRYLVWVIGQVRAGKTTFVAAYLNIRSKDLMDKAQRRIEFTCLGFPNVPFDCIEKVLAEDYSKGLIDADAEARKLLAGGQILSAYGNLSYDNHVSPKPVPFIEMLSGYIDARWALMRNNYVYYYAKAFHSRVTENDAMDYEPSMMAIKDRFRNENDGKADPEGDYHILPYSVIGEDERQFSGKDCTKFMDYSKQDSGAADCMRLIGQMGQETIYYVTDNQYWGTDINRERNLATEVVLINDSVAVNPRFMTMFCLRLAEIPARIGLRRLRRKAAKKEALTPLLEDSWERKWLSKTMLAKKKIASMGWVIYHGTIYHNPSDFGKKPKSAIWKVDVMRCVFPLTYCYGSIDTYQFHSVQKMLISQSRYRLHDEKNAADPDDLAALVLKKSSKAGKKSSAKEAA